jgi:hypothetical protein
MLKDLGINSNSIHYEVALEVLGQSRQPLMQAIRKEKEKTSPSLAFIRYCEMRLDAIDELQDELQPEDITTIEQIFAKDSALFKTK